MSQTITRPVATTLLSIGLLLTGIITYFLLPVASMPEVDFPAIVIQAQLPGASPETVATSVTTPLERHLRATSRRRSMPRGRTCRRRCAAIRHITASIRPTRPS